MARTTVKQHKRKTPTGKKTKVRQHNRNIKSSKPKPNYKNPRPYPNPYYIDPKDKKEMAKTKRVAGRTWERCNGAPALWCDGSGRRLSNAELENLRERTKKRNKKR